MQNYAGFWKRVAASLIDGIVIGIPGAILFFLFGAGSMSSLLNNMSPEGIDPAALISVMGASMFISLIIFIGSWLYSALLESSEKQATIGKMALGIIVTDLSGNRISFGRATGRYFSKSLLPNVIGMIPILGFIGIIVWYVMAAFTAKKQAVHDMIVSTLVVNK